MQDFNDYAKTADSAGNGDLFKIASDMAKKFDGKNANDLLKAIYAEAERGKRNGTLSDADLDKFAAALSPTLDDKKRAMLKKIVADLKKI